MKATPKYIPIVPNDGLNALKVEVYYSLGGVSIATYKNEPRGYYLSVAPVEQGQGYEGFKLFSGIKHLLLPCSRRSAKQEAEAIELAREREAELIQHVLQEHNLHIAEPNREVG